MRESTKKLLRIVTFILGGLLVITGIFLSGWGIQLLRTEGISSDFMPFIVSVITLAAGICICILAIKMPMYLAEANKMSREERLIENHKRYLKQRKNTVLVALMLGYILFCLLSFSYQIKELDTEKAKKISSMFSNEEPIRDLPFLFSDFYELTGSKTKLIIHQYVVVGLTIIVITFLIVEISGSIRDKYRLTVSMWERIQQLEDEVKELKSYTQVNGQQIADMDGGDSASGAE